MLHSLVDSAYFYIYAAGNKVYERKLLYIVKKQYFSVVFHKPENV